MMRSVHLLVLAFGTTLMVSQAIADKPQGNASMPDRAEVEAALDECLSSLETGNGSRPEPSAMDDCMSAKGFERPNGPPGHGGRGNGHDDPPPDQR
jgi:hypothetical protein